MLRLLALAGLAACYDPHPQAGAACGENDACPSSLTCVGGLCVAQGGALPDAGAPDAMVTMDDRDGDGVANATDNCPDAANPDQGDEDGDKLGDACDPCPIDADNTDGDGDGVAGSCDPNPTTAGDKILAFSGFHSALPATWDVVGTMARAGDDIAITTVANNHSAVTPPPTNLGNGTVMVRMTVDATVGDFETATTVAMPYNPDTDQGVFCELYGPSANQTGGHYVALWDSPQGRERGTKQFAWTIQTPYRVALTRAGQNYTCAVTPDGGTPQNASGQTSSAPMPSQATVAVYGANARVAWLLLVGSP